MLSHRSDIETSAQGFTRLIFCTYREQNPHCNFPLFSHTVPSFDPGAVADGKGAGLSFLFFISFCCNFCATGTSKEGERRWGHNEKGRGGHQRVREGIRWSSVAGITGGRGWNLTQQRWHAPPLPSSFISVRMWEGNSFLHCLSHKVLLIVANVWHNSLWQELCCVDGGLALGSAPPDHWEGNCWEEKLVREQWPVANTEGQWEATGV